MGQHIPRCRNAGLNFSFRFFLEILPLISGMFRTLIFLLCLFSGLCQGQSPALSLSEALHNAKQHNLFLKQEQIRRSIGAVDLKKSKLYQNPIFNLQYLQLLPSSSQYSQGKSPLHPYNSQDWFQFTKRFQVFGQRTSRISLAKLSTSIVESEVQEATREVLFLVAMKWTDAWQALVAKNLAIKAADYLDVFMTQYDSAKAGPMKKDEKLRFDILDDHYDLQESQAEIEYSAILQELKLLMGTPQEIEVDLKDTLERVSFENMTLDSLVNLALTNRKDVKSLQEGLLQANQNIVYQRSLAIPQPEGGFIWNPQNAIPYVGIYFTQPLPFFDRNHTEVQRAKLMANSSELALEASLREVRAQVVSAFSNYSQKKTLVKRFYHNLADSDRLLKMIREESIKGKDPIVDIWEAEQTWFQTYTLYYDAFVDYRKSYISLLYQLNLLDEVQ